MCEGKVVFNQEEPTRRRFKGHHPRRMAIMWRALKVKDLAICPESNLQCRIAGRRFLIVQGKREMASSEHAGCLQCHHFVAFITDSEDIVYLVISVQLQYHYKHSFYITHFQPLTIGLMPEGKDKVN